MIKGKKSLKISLFLIAAGVVLMGVGYLFGGSKTLSFTNNGINVNDSKDMVKEKTPIDSFQNIKLDDESSDIEIVKGDKYEIETVYDKSVVDINYSVTDNTLNINSSTKNHSSFNIMLFGSGNNSAYSKIKIYIPNDLDISEIKGKVSSGDINIQDLNFKTADITCSSGDAKLSNLSCSNMKMHSSSGHITIDNIDTSEINLNTKSGSITGSNLKSKDLSCELSSGTMRFDTLTTENAAVKNSSGSIKLNNVISNGLDISSSSGSVELNGELKGKNTIKTSSGGIEVNSTLPEKDYSYDLITHSGNCSVNGKDKDKSCEKDNTSSENRITASCRSGSLKVNFKG